VGTGARPNGLALAADQPVTHATPRQLGTTDERDEPSGSRPSLSATDPDSQATRPGATRHAAAQLAEPTARSAHRIPGSAEAGKAAVSRAIGTVVLWATAVAIGFSLVADAVGRKS
jgi:hypothetical protein